MSNTLGVATRPASAALSGPAMRPSLVPRAAAKSATVASSASRAQLALCRCGVKSASSVQALASKAAAAFGSASIDRSVKGEMSGVNEF